MPAESPTPIEIDCKTVHQQMTSASLPLLVDCREVDEHATAHIEGATLIPMSEFQGRMNELEPYRNEPIVIHCHHGGRSLRVAEWLRSQGFPQAQSMAGGIDEWSLQIDPAVPRY